jgi:hypothetical protein
VGNRIPLAAGRYLHRDLKTVHTERMLEVEVSETSVTTWSQTDTMVKLLDGDVTLMVGRLRAPPFPRLADDSPLPESSAVAQGVGVMVTNGRDQSLTIVADPEEFTPPVRAKRAVILEGIAASPIACE